MKKDSNGGHRIRAQTGWAEPVVGGLSAAGINMKMITTGDIKISVLVEKAEGVLALRAVHQAFGLDRPRPGAGLAGKTAPSSFKARHPALVDEGRHLATITQKLSSMEDIV